MNKSRRTLRTVLAVVCVIAVAGVGLLDYVTGPWMSFALFYVVPVLVAAWWLGRGPALAAGLAAGIFWFVAEAWGHRGEPTRVLLWNSISRLLMLLAMGAMTARIRDDQQRLRGANRRLAELLGDAERLARTDALTGLANGRAFTERLRQEVARAQRDGSPLCLGYVDVDNLKSINDAHGHAAGDELLREVARAIRQSVRTSDVAARLGGDEFAILFVGMRQEAAEAAARRLLERMKQLDELHPGLHLGASIGVAMYGAPPESAEEMIRAADAAMYEAKQRGKGRVVLWEAPPADAAAPARH
ncbi:MAG TPA: GGDEF domain-containing protein [Myxococcales bacterium]|nr:GGDEF domain-containing protein [Myxococcales bacterium]